jgi:hypothetical protein
VNDSEADHDPPSENGDPGTSTLCLSSSSVHGLSPLFRTRTEAKRSAARSDGAIASGSATFRSMSVRCLCIVAPILTGRVARPSNEHALIDGGYGVLLDEDKGMERVMWAVGCEEVWSVRGASSVGYGVARIRGVGSPLCATWKFVTMGFGV